MTQRATSGLTNDCTYLQLFELVHLMRKSLFLLICKVTRNFESVAKEVVNRFANAIAPKTLVQLQKSQRKKKKNKDTNK